MGSLIMMPYESLAIYGVTLKIFKTRGKVSHQLSTITEITKIN